MQDKQTDEHIGTMW